MRRDKEHWSVVILGNWNLAILNPDWFAREILEAEEVELQVGISGNARASLRYVYQDIIVIPTESRVTIGTRNPTDQSIVTAESIALQLLRKLPVTPVSAIGTNISFKVPEPTGSFLSALDIRDQRAIAQADLTSDEVTVSRTFLEDNHKLSITLSTTAEHEASLSFNFHSDVADTEAAVEAIENKTPTYLQRSIELARSLYELEEERPE